MKNITIKTMFSNYYQNIIRQSFRVEHNLTNRKKEYEKKLLKKIN